MMESKIFLLCVIYAGIKIVQIYKEYPQSEVVKVDAGEKKWEFIST